MARSRKFLAAGAAGVAALALIGAGAGATFTDATHSGQRVEAGTIDLRLTSPDAIGGNDSKTILMPNVGPTNSTFNSKPSVITFTNRGNVQADAIYMGISSTATSAADKALQSQLSVCIFSDGLTVFNGLVSTLETLGDGQAIAGPFKPEVPDTYTAEFYAGSKDAANGQPALGQAATLCKGLAYGGTYEAVATGLDNSAQGGVVGTSITTKYVG